MREGTAKELGIDGRELGWMRRRGEAEIFGKSGQVNLWRIKVERGQHIGETFRQMRIAKGWRQQDLREEAGYGYNGLPQFERTGKGLTMLTLSALLAAMGHRFAELHGDTGERLPPTDKPIGLHEAILTTLEDFKIHKTYHQRKYQRERGIIPKPPTIAQVCAQHNVDLIEFYRRLDAQLRWSK
jgi:transcriptional regulator with XRE-family HTH domain